MTSTTFTRMGGWLRSHSLLVTGIIAAGAGVVLGTRPVTCASYACGTVFRSTRGYNIASYGHETLVAGTGLLLAAGFGLLCASFAQWLTAKRGGRWTRRKAFIAVALPTMALSLIALVIIWGAVHSGPFHPKDD